MRFLLENVRIEIGEKKQDAYSPKPQPCLAPHPLLFPPLCVEGQFALPIYIDKQAHKINPGH